MTSPETTVLRKAVRSELTRRIGSGAHSTAVVAAARGAYDDVAAVLVPLISQAGVDALAARAFQLARGEYPADQPGEATAAGPFGGVSLWLERQDPSRTADAAAAMLATFGGLLAALIGQGLTTRYLRKAWPGGFSDTRSEGTQE